MTFSKIVKGSVGAVIAACAASAAHASAVNLVNATSTFSQIGYAVSGSADGTTTGNGGWGVFDGSATASQTAVWETDADFSANTLEFQLHHAFEPVSNPQHLLGNFRLSITSDDRSEFADGLQSGGDVTANWTVLTGATAVSSSGTQSLSVLGDGSVLAGGLTPNIAVYTVSFSGLFTDVTGVRLEALENAALPTNGPGTKFNGNFVLTEITLSQSTVSAVPVPATLPLLLTGIAGVVGLRRRQKRG